MAAASGEFGGILPFDCKGAITSVAPRWKKWKNSFEYYLLARGITNSARKKGLLLHCAGSEVQELFETLQDPGPPADVGEDNADEYQKALRTLDAHFSARLNEPYERHVFRNLKQEGGETVDQFITRLRHQAENCNWDNADEPIRDQVIDKCRSDDLRRKLLLKGTHLTLEKVQEIARSFEAVDIQLKTMTGVEDDRQQVNRIERGETAVQFKGRETKAKCYRCDREGHFSRDSCCPARNAECQRCHKIGNFAKVCQTKTLTRNKRFSPRDVPDKRRSNVNSIDDDNLRVESDDDEYAFTVGRGTTGGMINVLVGGISVRMHIDSGASTNVIDKGTWEELKSQKIECKSYSDIVEEFKDCFTGVGKLKGYELKLHIKENVAPVVQPLRRPPFNLRDKIEKKLDELENMDITEKVNSPSQWYSPVVVVPKPNGEVRLCVDMRQANCAVERGRYPIPEVLQDMNNSKVFSKLDLR
ncbi:Retrovirus-related Pol polyprotein from transposon opus [Stylophora pistillata]|uniref:Retrovirus-related Pol polyprotein from transposon opus n=1 Tax=Stylophora pistillata TaxID=50429 RepID=A0A2B4S9Z0_STYPI|nr:Retrovirus-related Pol polyprotein from transposon opus [Stylophora pistillata]